MAHLETLVANFQETDSDARFSSLNEQLSKVIGERDGLRNLLESFDFTIRSHLDEASGKKPLPSSAIRKDGGAQSLQSRLDVPDLQEIPGNEAFDTAASMNSSDDVQAWHDPEYLDLDSSLFQLPPLFPDFLSTIVPQTGLPKCECMLGAADDTGTTVSIWRQLNHLHQSLANIDLAAEDRESEDSIIRAVLYGWNSVTAAGRELNTCRMLRSIDELSGLESTPTDRLAILSLIRLMLVSQRSPRKAALPRWLQARPSQNLPHSIAIDFVFWCETLANPAQPSPALSSSIANAQPRPGIRERLVFSEHEYCADSFWRSAFSDTKLLWPMELSDAYVQNSVTGDLHLSPYFRMFIRDLGNWTVSPGFLKQYPELYNDIKGY
ncbi:hypothetical protein FVEG_12662 [Fusarium verticillioides 7600]|uniref:Transcription factor domain-containing protein n=1 Tax=Gibberella moniliformis (strain M3125 / FGSC 7600) TaxID=334819 RepID=W7NDR2_GIBM7|nr:hypothetical protein FVEG_12662 [Fusarium verticillioides 7600]EWG54447.1 hypothetical protein FVEG_12662 [Fusarium verticillioides 7600]